MAAGKAPAAGAVDELDRRIIAQLEEDGRRPYGRIADAIGLSETAVRHRVQRLVEAKVIRIAAVADPALLGYRTRATVGLRTEGNAMEIAAAVGAIAEVDHVVVTAGSFDLMVEVRCEDDGRLLELLNDVIRRIPGITATETFIHLRRSGD
jgi:Lrp/AsnC family transcriptional regulator for asnA, asnC and gidA